MVGDEDARAPHPTAAFQCVDARYAFERRSETRARARDARGGDVRSNAGCSRVHRRRARVSGVELGIDDAHEAAGDVPSTWTASSSRVVVGAYGDRSFLGTVHAVDVYDVALSDDELVEDASRPRWSPPPPSRDVVVVVGDDAPTDIALDARLSNPRDDEDRPLRFILLSLPTRGTVYVGGDDARVESVPRALERPTVRFSPEGESSAEEDASGEYARFHFEARESLNEDEDDDDDDGVAVERVVVRVRVVRANAAPARGTARVVAGRRRPGAGSIAVRRRRRGVSRKRRDVSRGSCDVGENHACAGEGTVIRVR